MRRDAKRILSAPEIRKAPYPSREFREDSQKIGEFRFSDLRPTDSKSCARFCIETERRDAGRDAAVGIFHSRR